MQLVKVLSCKLPTIDKKLPTFPNRVRGLNCLSQIVGGKCVSTLPLWPQKPDTRFNVRCKRMIFDLDIIRCQLYSFVLLFSLEFTTVVITCLVILSLNLPSFQHIQ